MAEAPLIRDAVASDAAAWRGLWQGYLDFLRTDLRPEVTDQTWRRIIDPDPGFRCRLALRGGLVVGFAMHHPHLSTWSIRPDCYLEDLFVAAEARGSGIGRALIDDLVAIARANGWERLYWMTEQTNLQARRLYDSYCESDGNIRYRFHL